MTDYVVSDLIADGLLRVEDGNHGNDRPRPDEFVSEGVAFIRAADMTSGVVSFDSAGRISSAARNRIRKGVGAPGDVLLSHKGTVGRVASVPMDAPEFVCSPQTTFWRSLDESRLDRRYLRYMLLSQMFQRQLGTLGSQTDMAPYVSLTDQRSMTVAVPEPAEQRAIAEVLGALDDKIAANGRTVQSIDLLSIQLMAAATASCPVADVAAPATTQLKPEQFDDMVAHFSLPAFDESRRPSRDRGEAIKSNKQVLDAAVVLVSKLNPRIPRIWDIPVPPDLMALASTEFVVLRPLGVSTSELAAAVGQSAVTTRLAESVSGTSGSHQRIKPAVVFDAEVPDPRTLSETARDVVTSGGLLAHRRRQENSQLAELRDTLLPALMSGRLSVKDAENTVSEVV